MDQRDAVFRQRLVAVMTALNGGEAQDPALRKLIGGYAQKFAKDAGVPTWGELKQRADAPTYDALLRLFEIQSQSFQQAGDTKGVRALEALALSLIARHQSQNDLLPGVGFLDRYIEECAAASNRLRTVVINTKPTAH